ncbi:MAG TPA: TA system VapC family ribonuclease toxin [Candidatus Angelobacter sp.]|nr:TA system VapC family ribonuclease toxin [Candidatus Angelobacter sp.]
MTVHLLDVNVLVALMWPAHAYHDRAQEWFGKYSKSGWATCPLTQSGCVRILSNPSFSSDAATPQQALKILVANLKHPSHQFWPDDVSFAEAVEPMQKQMVGHQQISDAYLLGLTLHRKAKLATMDRGVLALLAKDKQASVVVL